MAQKTYKKLIQNIAHSSGVYKFYDVNKQLLYIGKAIDLKKRVSQYFLRPHDERISQLVQKIASVKTIETDTNIEALILEANLINKHKPPYNVLLKDDKTFGGIFITDEKYPRVYSARITDQLPKGEWFGPYVSGNELKIALKVLRRIFRWCDAPTGANYKSQIPNPKQIQNYNTQNSKHLIQKLQTTNYKLQTNNKSCFYYHIGLCSGACVGAVTKKEYNRQIKHLKMFLCGGKKQLLKIIEKEMAVASKQQKYEQANQLKLELAGLQHIQESAFIVTGDSPIAQLKSELKIECFDVANIGNEAIVGGMVVFIGDKPYKNLYRKFKINTLKIQNDIGAMAEMVVRRFRHLEWEYPDLLLIDGGIGQVNAVRQILFKKNLFIPIVGIAKGAKRNKNELIGDISFVTRNKIKINTLISARDEAHRFARIYFNVLRKKGLYS